MNASIFITLSAAILLLLGLGLLTLTLTLTGYTVLGKLYWFSVPFRGVSLATILYCLGLAAHFS